MRWRRLAVLVAAVSVGLLILSKVFLYPNCFSFDSHDDANHAFPGLHVARAALAAGELPALNPYNNFGAPLLGDGLTYPFAVQALTYYLVDGPIAMSINRFVIAIITIVAAYLFFRIYLGLSAALLCTLLAFFNPVAFWYPVHQYQLAAPVFFIAIWLIDRLRVEKTARPLVLLFLLLTVATLSVSINHIVLMIPFVLAWSVCRNGFRIDRFTIAPAVALGAALVATFPQTAAFGRSFAESARAGEGVYDSILTSPRELFLGLILPPGDWIAYNYGAQLQVTSYVSMGVMLTAACGLVLIRRKPIWKQATLFFCGVVPTVLAIVLYVSPRLRFAIPLVKSVDISRVLWFSLPFCYVYAGYLISYARRTRLPRTVPAVLLSGSIATVIAIRLFPETASVSPLHSVNLLLIAAGAMTLLLQARTDRDGTRGTRGSFAGSSLLVCSLLLTPVPVIVRVLGLNTGACGGTQYSAHVSAARFTPAALLPLMERGNRMAAEIHTHQGHDFRVAREGLLGSAARGIVVDRAFGKSLEARKLVVVDQVPYGYYFSRPWQTDALSRLGIRYLLVNGTSDGELNSRGWTRLGTADGLSLYENPAKPTPVYLVDQASGSPMFLHDYEVVPNGIRVSLPASLSESLLLVTLVHRPQFVALVDGKPREFAPREGLIGIPVRAGDTTVDLRYRPYTWAQVAAGAAAGVFTITLFAACLLHRRRHRDTRHAVTRI